MGNRLDRLGHHGIIGRNHQHHDVRHLRAPGAHRGESRVAGRIEEGQNRTIVGCHLIGTDMLGDAAGFARHHVRVTDGIQKRGLAMVDVAHDRYDRRAGLQVFGAVLDRVDHLFHVGIRHTHRLVAELLDHQFGGVGVDGLVHGDHQAHLHQRLDHIGGTFGHAVGQLRHNDGFRQLHVAHLLFGLVAHAQRLGAGLFLLAPHRRHRTLAAAFAVQRLVQRQFAGAAVVLDLALAGAVVRGGAVVTFAVRLARPNSGNALGRGA